MAGLTQTSPSREPNYFLGFLSSRTFCRVKELKGLSLSRRSWRIQVKLEENGSQSSMGIRAVSSGAGGLEDKTSPPEKEKDPSRSSKSSGKFEHPMWKNGTWDIQGFTKDGKVDWNAVIDAEARRRKWLEDNPEASSNDEPVIFHTSVIPWWAWVIRFHLPEAELLNGRAAMIGFSMAYVIDSLTGVGLVDQMNSVFGKLLLLITVAGVLLIRKTDDVAKLRQLFKEWNAYDKQWQATWKEEVPETSEEE